MSICTDAILDHSIPVSSFSSIPDLFAPTESAVRDLRDYVRKMFGEEAWQPDLDHWTEEWSSDWTTPPSDIEAIRDGDYYLTFGRLILYVRPKGVHLSLIYRWSLFLADSKLRSLNQNIANAIAKLSTSDQIIWGSEMLDLGEYQLTEGLSVSDTIPLLREKHNECEETSNGLQGDWYVSDLR